MKPSKFFKCYFDEWEIQHPKAFRFCGHQSFLPSMYSNKGALISSMTMVSNQIKCSLLRDSPVYATKVRASTPRTR